MSSVGRNSIVGPIRSKTALSSDNYSVHATINGKTFRVRSSTIYIILHTISD
jgi:hypothetical protein